MAASLTEILSAMQQTNLILSKIQQTMSGLGATGSVPRSYGAGATTSNNAGTPNTKVDIAPGVVTDSSNTVLINSTATLTIDFGTVGANGLDAGAIAASTWYNIFVISQTGNILPAGIASTSLTPALPANYLYYRRVGSVRTTAGSIILPYTQFGTQFLWSTPIGDITGAAIGVTAVLGTISTPLGVKTLPLLDVAYLKAGVVVAGYSSSPDATDIAVSTTFTNLTNFSANTAGQASWTYVSGQWLRTNASSQLRFRCDTAGSNYTVVTFGWIDDLGRSS